MDTKDRRRSPRKPLEADVEYESGGIKIIAKLANIGRMGIYISTDSPLSVGTHLLLRFTLPDGQQIEASGRVAHRQTGIGMGIAFVSIRDEDIKQIQEFLDRD